jgi:hypothetical protein
MSIYALTVMSNLVTLSERFAKPSAHHLGSSQRRLTGTWPHSIFSKSKFSSDPCVRHNISFILWSNILSEASILYWTHTQLLSSLLCLLFPLRANICCVSTRSHVYKHLIVVFEAYPVSQSFKTLSRFSDPAACDLYAYLS